MPQAFSEAAFEDFYRDTFAAVWRIARRMAREDTEADDVCQKAYLAVYRYWSAGTLREPPSHLLYRVAKRGAIDLVRARTRGLRLLGALPRPADTALAVAGPLDRALATLRPADRALVLLQAAAGLSYEEIAAIERTTVSAVRSRLFRARRTLRQRDENEGGEW